MTYISRTIWQGGLRVAVATLIFVGSLTLVEAQSSSSSYKAVDFINPEASTSASGSYKLNDSMDYYGGVHASSSYTECTGDFAVLGDCGTVVVPPPPPPPLPPGGGGGGSGSINWDTPTCEDTGTCPVENPPVEEPTSPVVKKPFKLPDIKEPVTIVEPEVIEVAEPEPEKIAAVPLSNEQQEAVIKRLQGAAGRVGVQILRNVAPGFCGNLTCTETNLFKSTLNTAAPCIRTCSIYTFGGFRFLISCQNVHLIWLAIALLTFATFPIGVLVARKRKKARVAVRKK